MVSVVGIKLSTRLGKIGMLQVLNIVALVKLTLIGMDGHVLVVNQDCELTLKKRNRMMIKDINDIMPKLPGMKWGALTNFKPSNQDIKDMDKQFAADGKWHSILNDNSDKDTKGKIIDGYYMRQADRTKGT